VSAAETVIPQRGSTRDLSRWGAQYRSLRPRVPFAHRRRHLLTTRRAPFPAQRSARIFTKPTHEPLSPFTVFLHGRPSRATRMYIIPYQSAQVNKKGRRGTGVATPEDQGRSHSIPHPDGPNPLLASLARCSSPTSESTPMPRLRGAVQGTRRCAPPLRVSRIPTASPLLPRFSGGGSGAEPLGRRPIGGFLRKECDSGWPLRSSFILSTCVRSLLVPGTCGLAHSRADARERNTSFATAQTRERDSTSTASGASDSAAPCAWTGPNSPAP